MTWFAVENAALQHFLDFVADTQDKESSSATQQQQQSSPRNNNNNPLAIQLIPRVPTGEPNCDIHSKGIQINTIVFELLLNQTHPQWDATMAKLMGLYVVAVVNARDRVDVDALERLVEDWYYQNQQQLSETDTTTNESFGMRTIPSERTRVEDDRQLLRVRLAVVEHVASLCGFVPGTIPPVGHMTQPLTLVDQTLVDRALVQATTPNTAVVSEQNEQWQHPNVEEPCWLVGGGALPNHQCRLSLDLLLAQPSVAIGPIRSETLNTSQKIDGTTTTPNKRNVRDTTMAMADVGASSVMSTMVPTASSYKPFFAYEPPMTSIAEDLLNDPTLENPLEVTPVYIVGRLAGIRRMGRRLVFADLIPVAEPCDNNKTDHMVEPSRDEEHPWRSVRTGESMAVQLVAGKTFCENKGGELGEASLRRMKDGQLVWVQGNTNVENRDSLRNWVEKRAFEIVALDFQILQTQSPDGLERGGNPTMSHKTATNKLGASASQTSSLAPSSLRAKKQAPLPPGMSYLTLANAYPSRGSKTTDSKDLLADLVTVVDTMEAVQEFSRDVDTVVGQLFLNCDSETMEEGNPTKTALVGLDCEWKPTAGQEDPQPVLVLQVCLHPLQKTYIVDLQTLLRPLLDESAEMTPTEDVVSGVLAKLWKSRSVVKTGFGLSQDLGKLAASYPHIGALQTVHNVLDAGALAKTFFHVTRAQNSRTVTSSLTQLTQRFLGFGLNKEQQISDWSCRPLSPKQLEYAALDAIVTPLIVEKLMETVELQFWDSYDLGRWSEDTAFRQCVVSLRFVILPNDVDPETIKKLQAKRIVGNKNIVTQEWISSEEAPAPPSASCDDGTYTDLHGVLRIPAETASIKNEYSQQMIHSTIGSSGAKTKDDWIGHLLSGNPAIPDGAKIDFSKKLSYVEFADAVCLFVGQPLNLNAARNRARRTYPNEWLDNGRILTWFLREGEWQEGKSSLAHKLLATRGQAKPPSVILFVQFRKGGHFLCCGRCRLTTLPEESAKTTGAESVQRWNLVKLHLELMDWTALHQLPHFQELVNHPCAMVQNE